MRIKAPRYCGNGGMEAAMESQLVLINHLRELRTARHLSQKELAQMVGR